MPTNAYLNTLEGRARRPLPSGVGQPFEDPEAAFVPGFEVPWLQPLPDRLLGELPADPETVAVERSHVRLALVAALQLLSARQRASLILRDVLGFSAAEAADMLDTTVAAVTARCSEPGPPWKTAGSIPRRTAEPEEAQREVVDRYVAAFERGDVAGLTRLLAAEVVLEMPPMWNWYIGPTAYSRFMARVFALRGSDWRTLATRANGQPAIAAYARDGAGYGLHTLQVFTVERRALVRTTVYQDQEVFALFDLPTAFEH